MATYFENKEANIGLVIIPYSPSSYCANRYSQPQVSLPAFPTLQSSVGPFYSYPHVTVYDKLCVRSAPLPVPPPPSLLCPFFFLNIFIGV